MSRPDLEVILLADAPDALVEVCGVSLLERLLRILQRLDFRRLVVISTTPQEIGRVLVQPSWARADVTVQFIPLKSGQLSGETLSQIVTPEAGRCLIIPAGIYCDARLLAALAQQNAPAALVDSSSPEIARPLLEKFPNTKRGRLAGPVLLTKNFISAISPRVPLLDQVQEAIDKGDIGIIDAATQSGYIVSMRRDLRPLTFPAPAPDQRALAESLILNTAQNGTLDLPAYLHAPIETWIISHLCKTQITPNAITIAGFVIGIITAICFATGHLGWGTLAALVFGLVDGLDGKQARVKIETTKRGEWEHELDYVIENSWWAAIAFYLWQSGQLPSAFYLFALLIVSHTLDGFVKLRTKILTGRQMDDLTRFDRAFRLIGGRRNIYVWMLAIGLLSGHFGDAYGAICGWAALTFAVHLVRFIGIYFGTSRRVAVAR